MANKTQYTDKVRSQEGFSTVEVLITTMILLPVFVSVVYMFVKCVALNELARNSSQAVWEVRNKMSEIEDSPVNQIKLNYDLATFASNELTGIGVTYVDDTQPNIVDVTTTFCWREKNGRVVGEDTNLDGQLDAGEDLNANGRIDSTATVRTLLYKS